MFTSYANFRPLCGSKDLKTNCQFIFHYSMTIYEPLYTISSFMLLCHTGRIYILFLCTKIKNKKKIKISIFVIHVILTDILQKIYRKRKLYICICRLTSIWTFNDIAYIRIFDGYFYRFFDKLIFISLNNSNSILHTCILF